MNGDTEKEVYKGLPKEKKKIARIHISRSIRTFIIVSLSASILSSCLYWYFVEFHQKLVPESVPVYSYSCKADVTYKVMLLPNDIVPEESLGENKAYISQFVDYIDTAFAFEYSGDEEAQLSGSYGATAYLRGVVTGLGDNVVLWTKEYELIPQTEFHKTGHQAAVNYRAPVDYNSIREYGEAVKDFLDISSNLQLSVVYTLSIDAETEKGTVHEEFAPSITIPVSGDYFRITKNTEGEKAGTIDESRQTVSPHYRMKKNFCYTAAGSLSLALLFVLIFTKRLVLSPRLHNIKTIFKRHGARIVTLNANVRMGNAETIEVFDFDGLVKIADDLGKPIFYHRGSSHFFVIDSGIDYSFLAGNEDESHAAPCVYQE